MRFNLWCDPLVTCLSDLTQVSWHMGQTFVKGQLPKQKQFSQIGNNPYNQDTSFIKHDGLSSSLAYDKILPALFCTYGLEVDAISCFLAPPPSRARPRNK